MNEFYKRSLPHIQPLGGTFFVTYNLFGCIPKKVLSKWKEEYDLARIQILKSSIVDKEKELDILNKKDFLKRDVFLDTYEGGFHYLKDDNLAKIVSDTLHFWDDKKFELYSYCIMSNHVHAVFRLFDDIENPSICTK